ncbi:MAG: YafY family transcriptional regulator [Treponema sp.]|jgi:predicted DNA-binding transcriptional regulator YafY|nr:YafY family transcriptional regulator [Treponema sp.]
MQIHRLFEIVYLLLDKKGITARELAAHFEVSVRTILRDIDTLGEAGIPVYTLQGKGGGIYLPEHFTLDKTSVSMQEKENILFSLQALKAADYPDIDTTLSKLISFFNMPQPDWIEVDFSRWGNVNQDKEKFELLKNAIFKNEIIGIHYASSYENITQRNIYPLKLIFKSKAWYLSAFCLVRNDYRTFKINRIIELKLTGDYFSREKISSLPLKETETLLHTSIVHLNLSFTSDMISRIYDEFSPESIQAKDDGTFSVEADMLHDDWLYSLLLSFGASVQVIEPLYVKENLLKELKKMQELY